MDHSNTERWLIYGHDLTSAFSPIVWWLAIITTMIVVIRVVKIAAWIRHKWLIKHKPSSADILTELQAITVQLQTLPILKADIVLIRQDIAVIRGSIGEQAGRIDGAADAVKTIMRDAALRERNSINEIKLEVKKMEQVHNSITELIAHLPTSGSA